MIYFIFSSSYNSPNQYVPHVLKARTSDLASTILNILLMPMYSLIIASVFRWINSG